MELTGWPSENMCKLSFHWPVKIEGDISTCLQYKEPEKGCRKNTSTGSTGSIELNVNSSLCFGKNSHLIYCFLYL